MEEPVGRRSWCEERAALNRPHPWLRRRPLPSLGEASLSLRTRFAHRSSSMAAGSGAGVRTSLLRSPDLNQRSRSRCETLEQLERGPRASLGSAFDPEVVAALTRGSVPILAPKGDRHAGLGKSRDDPVESCHSPVFHVKHRPDLGQMAEKPCVFDRRPRLPNESVPVEDWGVSRETRPRVAPSQAREAPRHTTRQVSASTRACGHGASGAP